MERESFVFYRSFYEAIRRQPKKVQADIYNAIADYALNGTEPTDSPDAVVSIFLLVKPQIDANNIRYEVGKKGGRPKKNKTNGFENNEKTKTDGFENTCENDGFEKPNVNVNENVNVNVNGNVNDNENVNAASARKRTPKREPVVYYHLDEKLNQAVVDFIAFRKTIKAPMTDKAVELMMGKLDGMTEDNNEKIAILQQSIVNGWKGIFPLKDEKTGKQSGNTFLKIAEELAAEEGDELF